MAIVPIQQLKNKFQTGDIPTGQDFEDLIDTASYHADALGNDGNPVTYINGVENLTSFDSIDTTEWRTIKYLVQLSHTSSGTYSSSELNIIFDGSNINISEYGTVSNTEGRIGIISASINNGIISMMVTPSVSPINLRFIRTGIKA